MASYEGEDVTVMLCGGAHPGENSRQKQRSRQKAPFLLVERSYQSRNSVNFLRKVVTSHEFLTGCEPLPGRQYACIVLNSPESLRLPHGELDVAALTCAEGRESSSAELAVCLADGTWETISLDYKLTTPITTTTDTNPLSPLLMLLRHRGPLQPPRLYQLKTQELQPQELQRLAPPP